MPRTSVDIARKTAVAALENAGAPQAHAQLQADVLVEAELRGLPSHGLMRLPRLLDRIANGVANPGVRGNHVWRSPGYLLVDGMMGFGPVVAMHALDAACVKVEAQGVIVVAVANSNHLGMLAYYAEKVAQKGKILIALSTSEALVHPWGGRTAMIGTNPIAFGIPHDGGEFVGDAATSLVAMGRIHDHANRNAPIPAGWALDADGAPTTDPHRAKDGAIAPFGGAKGYALGLSFELLVSALTGAPLGRDVRGTLDATAICNKGDVFIVIDAPAAQLSGYLEAIRSAPAADGFDRVRIPGERAAECRTRSLAEGLELPDEVWAAIERMAGRSSANNRKSGE